MSFSDLQKLRTFLEEHINASGTQFSLSTGEIDSVQVDKVIEKYLSNDGKTFELKSPTKPAIKEDEVTFSGNISTLLGLTPALIELYFGLDNTGNATLLVSLKPTSADQPKPVKDWNLGTPFPIWAQLKSPLVGLKFERPEFYISSSDLKAANGRSVILKGLNFTAEKLIYTGLVGLFNEKFTSAFQFTKLAGNITNTTETPFVAISSDPITPIPIGNMDLPFAFSAVSKSYTPEGVILSTPILTTYLQVAAHITLGKVNIPIEARSGEGQAGLTLVAALTEVNDYGISMFEKLVNNAPIGSYLSKYVDIGDTVGLRDLQIVLNEKPFGIDEVKLNFGTKSSITVIENYIEIPDISARFQVKDPMGSKDIEAKVTGSFDFLNNVPVQITATYPEMIFRGELQKGNNLTIQKVFHQFLPSVTHIPNVVIANLAISADLKKNIYGIDLAITSEWKIPIGIAEFQLNDAKLNLKHKKAESGFTGDITANAALFDRSSQKIATFDGDWNLPGNFSIKGEFPKIKLSKLASSLTGGYLSDTNGFPEIDLINSIVTLSISNNQKAFYTPFSTSATTYDFSLSTEIDVIKIGKADLYFQVKESKSDTGFIAGIVVQPDWTPASVWPGLKDVFDILVVKEAGLILSTLTIDQFNPPNFKSLPYIPDKIQPGITFFSELELKGDAFALLKKLFDDDIVFDLYAFINPKDLTSSEIKASLPASKGRGILTFNGLAIDMKPGAGKFSITASAKLKIENEELALVGSGTMNLNPPNVSFAIDIHCWKEPFGIKGLTIIDFGVNVGISELVTLGLLGNFLIGEKGDSQFKFLIGGVIIDFEVPGAFVFGLDAANPEKPLKVVDLIKQFTSLDLNAVPLINDLAFKNLDFYVVDDPNGWTAPNGHLYKPGIGLDADILFLSYELKLLIEVNFDKGIIANGNLNKAIDILDILTISDATGKLGPSASIDTTNLPEVADPHGLLGQQWEVRMDDDCDIDYMDRIIYTETFVYPEDCIPAAIGFLPITILTAGDQSSTYFSFSGGIKFLGLTESFSGSATTDGFEVNFRTELADLFKANFMCSYVKGSSFKGNASGNFDFNLDFPDGLTIDGIPILPAFTINGPYASLDIACAIDLSDPFLSFALNFNWGSFKFDVDFKNDPKTVKDLLSKLWEHIKNWINNNLKEFFKDLLADVEKFVEAIKNGVLKLGQSAYFIARALYNHFKQDMAQVAKCLYQDLSFAFNEVVQALVKAFDATLDEVLRLMSELFDSCATETADVLISNEQ